MSYALRCGCIPGRRPCAEAERLWEAVADAHHRWAKEGESVYKATCWLAFETILVAYSKHLEPEPEAGEQLALGGGL